MSTVFTFTIASGFPPITVSSTTLTAESYGGTAKTSSVLSVTIGNTVTSLGTNCFQFANSLKSIDIPNSVTSFGNHCFNGSNQLTSVLLGNSLKSLGIGCFMSTPIASIQIPNSVTYMDANCFRYCVSLKSVILGNSQKKLSFSTFEGCINLPSILIPKSVTSIESNAFFNCSKLLSVTYEDPSKISSIGTDYMKTNGLAMTSVKFYLTPSAPIAPSPATHVYITTNYPSSSNFEYYSNPMPESSTFTFSSNIQAITVYDSIITADSYGGSVNKQFLISATIGNGVKSLEANCFFNCSALASIGISTTVTSLGISCFASCVTLSSITIPVSVSSLGENCFESCSLLTSATIGTSVSSLKNSCFASCVALASFTIPVSVSSLGNSCFKSCSSLSSITIPDSVSSLGENCFESCSLLTSATIGTSVSSLKNSCFASCVALASFTIPVSVSSLGNSCFKSCSSLSSITIPDSVSSLGENCFESCSSLVSIIYKNPSIISVVGNNYIPTNTSGMIVQFYLTESAPIAPSTATGVYDTTKYPDNTDFLYYSYIYGLTPLNFYTVLNVDSSVLNNLTNIAIPNTSTVQTADAILVADVKLSVLNEIFYFYSPDNSQIFWDLSKAIMKDFTTTNKLFIDDNNFIGRSKLIQGAVDTSINLNTTNEDLPTDYVKYIAQVAYSDHTKFTLFKNSYTVKNDLTSDTNDAILDIFYNNVVDQLFLLSYNSAFNIAGAMTNHILNDDEDRFKDMQNFTTTPYDDNGNMIQLKSIPFIVGDKIIFKITITPPVNQLGLISTAGIIPTRTYLYTINVISG